MAISPRGVVRSTSCLVLRWGFRGRRIEWRYFRLTKFNRYVGENNARVDWSQSKVFLVKYIATHKDVIDGQFVSHKPTNEI